MKSSRLRIALLALLCGTTSLHADILMMKNGTKIEGSILQETPEAVRIRYRMTPKIWDEKSVPMAEIEKVIKQTPQEVEVVELRKLAVTGDLVSTDQYEQTIQDRLRPFVNKYKGTPEAKEVEGIIAKLQEEKTKVSDGAAKIEGKWLSVQEAKAEKFNIEAYKILHEMRNYAAQSKYSKALQEFDKLTKGAPVMRATRYYPTAVTEAMDILDKWSAILTKMAADQPVLKKQRDDGLKKLEGVEKERTQVAINAELASWRTEVADAKAKRLRWIEPNKYDQVSIIAAQKEANTEKARLRALDLDTIKAQNEAYGAVLAKIGEGDYTGGAAAFARVQGYAAPSLYKNSYQALEAKEVVEDIKSQLLNVYKQIVAKQGGANPIIKPGAGGTSSTSVDDRVAKILAGAGGAPAPAATGPATTAPAATTPAATAPAAATQAAPGTIAPAPGTSPAARPGTVPGVNPAAQVRPAPQPVPAPAPVAQQAAPAPEENNMQLYMLIGAGVLILVLVVALLNKKK